MSDEGWAPIKGSAGAMRQSLEAAGRRALSVDWRLCDVGDMHAVLDVRDVVTLGGWERVFLFPPCFQQLRADHDCLPSQIADCRAYCGSALVWCVVLLRASTPPRR